VIHLNNVEKYGTAEQATDVNKAHAHCMLEAYGYKHTLGLIAVPLEQW